jgi:hypothetical protein
LRASRELVEVEGMEATRTPSEAAQALVRAAAAGKLAPDVAAELVAAIAACVRVIEIDELTARLAALEQRQ